MTSCGRGQSTKANANGVQSVSEDSHTLTARSSYIPYLLSYIYNRTHSSSITQLTKTQKEEEKKKFKAMKPQLVFFLAFLFLFSLSEGLNPICDTQDHSSTLQVFHVFSPCSPFKPSKPLSWEESVLEMLAKDQARLQFLSSLAVARKSVVPIASGRQITQSPTYIVRAKIGTPAQTLLMAMDTSNDAAWVPCTGCVGCSSTVFNSAQSTTFKNLGCQAAQCKQVINFYFL